VLDVKEGIDRMLERVDLTDEERAVVDGDREVLTSLVGRLADMPTPAGPTPRELGTVASFVRSPTCSRSTSPAHLRHGTGAIGYAVLNHCVARRARRAGIPEKGERL
jgi:hypothetical protein